MDRYREIVETATVFRGAASSPPFSSSQVRQVARHVLVCVNDAVVRPLPWCCESALLEALLKDAQPRTVPVQHLCPIARPIHEEEHVAGRGVVAELVFHEVRQRIEGLAKVRRRRRREYLPTSRAQHRSISARW